MPYIFPFHLHVTVVTLRKPKTVWAKWESTLESNTGMIQLTNFDILKFSIAARLRGHKQRKLNDHVYSFLLFVSSGPRYQAEF